MIAMEVTDEYMGDFAKADPVPAHLHLSSLTAVY